MLSSIIEAGGEEQFVFSFYLNSLLIAVRCSVFSHGLNDPSLVKSNVILDHALAIPTVSEGWRRHS